MDVPLSLNCWLPDWSHPELVIIRIYLVSSRLQILLLEFYATPPHISHICIYELKLRELSGRIRIQKQICHV